MEFLNLQDNNIIVPSIKKFYSNHYNAQKFLDIRFFDNKLSLRIFNWFCVNYAKKHQIYYRIRNGTEKNIFNVYHSYKLHLKTYKKKMFDPINRGEQIVARYQSPVYHNNDMIEITTSLCQLNFFKWAIENMVFKYIENHHDKIFADMQEIYMQQYSSESKAKRAKDYKRNELSENIYNKIQLIFPDNSEEYLYDNTSSPLTI